jgi:DNA-directed RNA polymerase specialized sigma24 family protein
LNHYILSYYPAIFNTVVRLTGWTDQQEAEMLTHEVLDDLLKRIDEFEADGRSGVFIYRLVVGHVFNRLKQRGEEERIRFLEQILLIHPSHYLGGEKNNPPPETSQQGE